LREGAQYLHTSVICPQVGLGSPGRHSKPPQTRAKKSMPAAEGQKAPAAK